MNLCQASCFSTTKRTLLSSLAVATVIVTPVSAWWGTGIGSTTIVQRALPSWLLAHRNPKQASVVSIGKPRLPCGGTSGGPSGACGLVDRHGDPLTVTKAAKEGNLLESVKVGPLKQEQVLLPSGISMETLSQAPSRGSAKLRPLPPLVFIHGSFHAAWCWAEHWMPFFANKGYETYSISLRGTSGTSPPGMESEGKAIKVKMSEHVSDVKGFLRTFLPGKSPVIVAHSLGGMVLLKLLEELAEEYQAGAASGAGAEKERSGGQRHGIESVVAGCVFLCSVPPSGNGPMTKRFIKERPLLAVKLVLAFVLKMAIFWPWLARDLFFTKALEQKTLKRYLANFRADSVHGLDIMDMNGKLPSRLADAEGRARWIQHAPPRLVMGAERDRMVDEAGIEEMAAFLDTSYTMLPTVPHEVMLGPDWPLGVDRLLQWLETTDFYLPSAP